MAIKTAAKIQKGRLALLVGLILLFWLGLEANLFYRQVRQHDRFEQMAENQYMKRIPLPANRGAIYDRGQNKMVNNTIKVDIAADPKVVTNKKALADACSETFHKPRSYYLKKLNQNTRFTYLERRVSAKDIQPLLALEDRGLIKTKSFHREYPYRTYAAHLLGFTDPDDKGLSGLELQYEKQLRGVDGEAVLQYDGPRHKFYDADTPIHHPIAGNDIYLTIDKNIQTVVEQELDAGVRRVGAKAGMAVLMDPYSGAVIALANYPTFDPNRQKDYSNNAKRNRAITDVFEPGSTMKIFTAAALLQEQLKKEDDIVYCEQGRYKIYNRYFHDTKPHGWLSFKRVIAYSSNVGMIKLSEELPKNTMFRYLRNFGMGSETGLGLYGEAGGLLENPQKWSGVSRASISIGYEIGVTAIQLATAYCAVVNGGYLYRPYIIDHIQNAYGDVIESSSPKIIRQVISAEVSEKLKAFMYEAVEEGTGKMARIDGLTVGGKTGTARKMDPKTKKYSTRKYVASFVGFAPYDKPRYVLAVIIDEPKLTHYGGTAAAPVFNKVINRIIHLDSYQQPHYKSQPIMVEKMKDVPPVRGYQVRNACAILEAKGMKYKLTGKGPVVRSAIIKKDVVVLECGTPTIKQDKVPQLTGLTLREALQRVDLSRFRIRLQGRAMGVVKSQQPPPGRPVSGRTALTLVCR